MFLFWTFFAYYRRTHKELSIQISSLISRKSIELLLLLFYVKEVLYRIRKELFRKAIGAKPLLITSSWSSHFLFTLDILRVTFFFNLLVMGCLDFLTKSKRVSVSLVSFGVGWWLFSLLTAFLPSFVSICKRKRQFNSLFC